MLNDHGVGDPVRIGPYTVLSRLRSEDHGVTYLGRSDNARVVDITVLRPDLIRDASVRERLRIDVTAALTVSGSFIAPLVDADLTGSEVWLASAHLSGLTLHEAVVRHGALPESSLRVLAAGIATALARIHAAGMVHGALDPRDVLLAADGPRMTSLGMSRIRRVAGGCASQEPSPDSLGDPKADMSALGAVVVLAASGRAANAVGPDGAPDVSTLPSSLRDVIGGCLHPDPAARPSAHQLVDYLARQAIPGPAGSWLPAVLNDAIAAADDTARLPVNHVVPRSEPVSQAAGVSRRNVVIGLASGAAVLVGGSVAAAAAWSGGSSPGSARLLPTGGGHTSSPPSPPRTSPTTAGSSLSAGTDGPPRISLDGPEATKAWQVVMDDAPEYLVASADEILLVSQSSTSFLNAAGKSVLSTHPLSDIESGGTSSLVTYANGMFYVVGADANYPDVNSALYAVNPATGKSVWGVSLEDPGNSENLPNYVAVNGSTVFVCGGAYSKDASATLTGYIWAFDAATGRSLWKTQGTDINNVLIPPSGRYLLAASGTDGKGQVQMIDAGANGARGWKQAVANSTGYYVSGWPMTGYAGGLFVFGGSEIVAVDPATGAQKWNQQAVAMDGSQVQVGIPFPSLDGATVYIPIGQDLTAFNAADGAPKWIATLVDSNELVVPGIGTGGNAWCTADTVLITGLPVDADGITYRIWAIDAATGKARWKYDDPGQPDVGFIWTVGGDYVYVASNLTVTAIAVHGE